MFLTDDEIHSLLQEEKILPGNFRSLMTMKLKSGHKEHAVEIKGSTGNAFQVALRQSLFNPNDFSVILVYCPLHSNAEFRLRRYNEKSHQHSNVLEREIFYDFHVHTATERYQEIGKREDTYAQVSDRFATLEQALTCLVRECGFDKPFASQEILSFTE